MVKPVAIGLGVISLVSAVLTILGVVQGWSAEQLTILLLLVSLVFASVLALEYRRRVRELEDAAIAPFPASLGDGPAVIDEVSTFQGRKQYVLRPLSAGVTVTLEARSATKFSVELISLLPVQGAKPQVRWSASDVYAVGPVTRDETLMGGNFDVAVASKKRGPVRVRLRVIVNVPFAGAMAVSGVE